MRSLQKHFNAFQEFPFLQPNLPDVIYISETRIKNYAVLDINVFGYSFIHNDSHTNARGFAMYISIMIQYNLLTDIHMDITDSENIWINISESNLIIGTIYRHPKNDIQTSNNILSSKLEQLKSIKSFFVVQNFNTALNKIDFIGAKSFL